MYCSKKVKLTKSLTKQMKGLKKDSVGYTIGKYGLYSISDDNYVGVIFPNIAILDVSWNNLEILEDYQSKFI